MHIFKILVFFISAIAIAQPVSLSNAEISGFKKEVALQVENLETLSSDFIQTKHIQLMEDKMVSTGRLFYKFPNILKWEYKDPYHYVMIFKENQLFVNDEGDKSISNLKSNKLFEKLVLLISGSVNGKLLADPENFDVKYYKAGSSISAVIVPKDPSLKQMFNEIILVFNSEHYIDSVKLMEEEGDFTEIEFRNIKMNNDLKGSVFQH